MKLSNTKAIITLIIVSVILRLIFLKLYPIGADSFYFLEIARDCVPNTGFMGDIGCLLGETGFIVFLGIVSILCVVAFYFFCRIFFKEEISFLVSFLFAISPLVFTHTQFNFIDRNPLALLLIIQIYILLFSAIKTYWKVIGIVVCLLILKYLWAGWFFMIIILTLYLLVKFVMEKKYWHLIGVVIVFLVSFRYVYLKIINYGYYYLIPFSISKTTITELAPFYKLPFQIEYILIGVAVVYLILNKDFSDVSILFILTLPMFLYVFRLNIFFVPLLFLLIGKFILVINEEFSIRWVNYSICAFFALMLVIGGSGVYNAPPLMNDKLLPVFSYINIQDSECLISLWNYGHLYSYYTTKEVMFKGSTTGHTSMIDYYVNGKVTDCLIVFHARDLKVLDDMLEYEGQYVDREEYWVVENLCKFERIGEYYVYKYSDWYTKKRNI